MPVTELERREMALNEANKVLTPLLGGARRLLHIAELARVHTMRTKVLSTIDKRVHIMIMDLFMGHPLVLALYTSTQESRSTSPSQLSRRINRLRKEIERMRGREFTAADIIYVYIAKRRLTRGAYKEARTKRIIVSLSGEEARRRIARYILARLNKLVQKIASTRIWGRLALFTYALIILAHRLGAIKQEPSIIMAVKAYESGIDVTRLKETIGPPS